MSLTIGSHLCERSRIGKSTERESRLVVARSLEEEKMGSSCLVGMGFSCKGDENTGCGGSSACLSVVGRVIVWVS